MERELHATQRDKSELRAKVEALHDKIRQLEAEKRASKSRSKSYERPEKSLYSDNDSIIGSPSVRDLKLIDTNILRDSNIALHSLGADVTDPLVSMYEKENRELKIKLRRLENQLAEKVRFERLAKLNVRNTEMFPFQEAELSIARSKLIDGGNPRGQIPRDEVDRLRASALQSERLLESREASHRQQIIRLESQVFILN